MPQASLPSGADLFHKGQRGHAAFGLEPVAEKDAQAKCCGEPKAECEIHYADLAQWSDVRQEPDGARVGWEAYGTLDGVIKRRGAGRVADACGTRQTERGWATRGRGGRRFGARLLTTSGTAPP